MRPLSRRLCSSMAFAVGAGTGSSKKEAEAAAALDALERMGYTHNGVILKKKL